MLICILNIVRAAVLSIFKDFIQGFLEVSKTPQTYDTNKLFYLSCVNVCVHG